MPFWKRRKRPHPRYHAFVQDFDHLLAQCEQMELNGTLTPERAAELRATLMKRRDQFTSRFGPDPRQPEPEPGPRVQDGL